MDGSVSIHTEDDNRHRSCLVWRARGGRMQQLLATLAAKRAPIGPGASDITAMLPDFSRGWTGEALWTLPVITFVVHLAVQWWRFGIRERNLEAEATSRSGYQREG